LTRVYIDANCDSVMEMRSSPILFGTEGVLWSLGK